MERNPYTPPKAEVSDPDLPNSEHEIASRGRRFSNLIIDFLGYLALSFLVGIIIALTGLNLPLDDQLFQYTFGMIVMTAYYVPLELMFGRTLGKLITGTRVVTEAGGHPSFAQVLRRNLIRFIPFEPFSYLTRNGIGWHDRWSDTRVIRSR